MTMLHRYTLKYNKENGGWDLKDQIGQIITSFPRKTDALAGGRLEELFGQKAGTVCIHRKDGKFAEERTYPRSRDSRSSPG